MNVRTPLLCFALLLPLLSGAAEEGREESLYERRPARESYVDGETGVTLPPRIGRFRKTEVVRNFNPLIGTVVRYSDPDGNCGDVYIYSLSGAERTLTQADARAHFRTIHRAIVNLPKKSSQVTEVLPLEEKDLNEPPNVFGRSALFRIRIAGDFRTSELTVFPFGSKIVKLRISSSPYAPKDEDLSYFTKAVCTAFNAVR